MAGADWDKILLQLESWEKRVDWSELYNFSLKKDNSGFLSDFWEVLAGPPELFADVDSDSSSDDDDGDDWSEDDDDNGNPIVNADVEPVCVIMWRSCRQKVASTFYTKRLFKAETLKLEQAV